MNFTPYINILRLPLSYHETLTFPLLWLLCVCVSVCNFICLYWIDNQAHIKFKEKKKTTKEKVSFPPPIQCPTSQEVIINSLLGVFLESS